MSSANAAERVGGRPIVLASAPHELDAVLRPASIAVVGASADPTKRGHRAVQALRSSGYRGRIIPVHPAGGELAGLRVARGPADVDAPPDLVLICTPAATVCDVIAEWGARGTRGAVVLAAGYRESGAAGAQLEADVVAAARRTGVRVVGPNTSGILNVPIGLNLIGLEGVSAGPLALLVQSGNMALALTTEGARAGVGFSFVIGVGNESDIAFHEYLDFLAADRGTGGILIHAEGFRDGRAFLAAAARAASVKPVVALKGGRTDRGSATARSHTGAIAGSYDVLRAGLQQAGVIEVKRSDELLSIASTLVRQPPLPLDRGIVVLSDGGGHAAIAADDLHGRDVPLASLASATESRLRALLGPAAAVGNPVDLAGAADRDPLVFTNALEIIAQDPSVGGVLVAGLFGGYAIRFDRSLLDREVAAAERLPAIAREAGVALVVHSLYADAAGEPIRILQSAAVPVMSSLETACGCMAAAAARGASIARQDAVSASWPAERRSGGSEGTAGPDPFVVARREGRALLLEHEARALLAPFRVPLVPAVLCASPVDALAAARGFDTNVAIRVVSPSAAHKTEAGGVALDCSPDNAADEASRVMEAVREHVEAQGLAADIRGVLVSPMLPRPLAELIAGVRLDPQFGLVLVVGAGGTNVEWMQDVALRVLPVSASVVMEMLDELRMAPVLHGYRGEAAVARNALVECILGIAECALAHPAIAEMEVNPLFAYADSVIAADVRIFGARTFAEP